MNISDILDSVGAADSSNLAIDAPGAQAHRDLQDLTRAWISERAAPELLTYPTDLMDRTMTRLRAQIDTIESLTGRMDAGASFQLVVLQTELERFKFLVRSLLRARIAKVDAHPQHYILPAQIDLLSPIEQSYLTQHNALIASHYSTTFLAAFPPKLRRLDDRGGAGGVGMVEGPDLDTVVFVRCLGPIGVGRRAQRRRDGYGRYGALEGHEDDEAVDADERDNKADDDVVAVSGGYGSVRGEDNARNADGSVRGEARIIRMRRGDVWLVRWSAVREAVIQGVCQLL